MSVQPEHDATLNIMKLRFWLLAAILAWFGRDGVRGQSQDLQIRYLQAWAAQSVAAAQFEQSLTPQQKAWRDENLKQGAILEQIQREIYQECTAAGKLPGKRPSGEPACADKPKTEEPKASESKP